VDLRQTLKLAHDLFTQAQIEHALIGGLAFAYYGSTRATVDLDLLIHENDGPKAKAELLKNGFFVEFESPEVIQLNGLGYIDLLLARRPISQKMLFEAHKSGPEGIRVLKAEDLIGLKIQAYKNNPRRELQDKTDIQFLIESDDKLDWNRIKEYADLFNEWEVINELKAKTQS
jgi:hypothetical protein